MSERDEMFVSVGGLVGVLMLVPRTIHRDGSTLRQEMRVRTL